MEEITKETVGGGVREVLEKTIEWLNATNEQTMGEAWEESDRVTMDSWFDTPGDNPRLMLDQDWGGGSIDDRRVLCISGSPFHDEGGSATITATFYKMDPWSGWTLSGIMFEFDTIALLIYTDGRVLVEN